MSNLIRYLMLKTVDMHRPWPLTNRVLFSFFSIYLLLYDFAKYFPSTWWNSPVTWTGRLLIDRNYTIDIWPGGSGDTTFNYLQLFCMMLLAVAGSVLWLVIAGKRKNYDKVQYWIMIALCYQLAVTMFSYGIAKVFPGQFISPLLYQLDQPLREGSPMGLAWTFMGYSRGYTIFSGLAECLGALLLLFRPTRLLGSLVTAAVLVNVVAMNFFYDICVKLYSSHLLLTALFLAVPDIKRLAQFFVLQQPVTAPNRYYPVFNTRWKRNVFNGIRYLTVAAILWGVAKSGMDINKGANKRATKGPIYGTYDVIACWSPSPSGSLADRPQAFPLLKAPPPIWKTFYFELGGWMFIRDMATVKSADLKVDTVTHTLSWKTSEDMETIRMHYTIKGDTMILNGLVNKDTTQITLSRRDTDRYELTNRGFHWINEYPYNK